jgi:hypothetical protein
MAQHITLDDVQLRLPQLPLSETSKPSTDAASAFIDDMEAEFMAELIALGYDPTVTISQTSLPISFPIYRSIVAGGVIAKILNARAAAVGGDAAVKSADRAQKDFDGRLARLRDRTAAGTFELADWPRTSKAVLKPSILLTVPDSDQFTEHDGENWPLSRRARMSQVF